MKRFVGILLAGGLLGIPWFAFHRGVDRGQGIDPKPAVIPVSPLPHSSEGDLEIPGPFAVSLPSSPWDDARLVDQSTTFPEPGLRNRVHLWETGFKFPYLVEVSVEAWDPRGNRWIKKEHTVRVGSHLLVMATPEQAGSLGAVYDVMPVSGELGIYRVEFQDRPFLKEADRELVAQAMGPGSVVEWDSLVSLAALPNDLHPHQWYHEQLDSLEGWDIRSSALDVVVAVIDSGIALTHEDLAPNIWTNPGESGDNQVDDDNNGLVDDLHGYDFYDEDPDPTDEEGHGTAMAGVIGAKGNNETGIAGICWDVQMMALRFLDAHGRGTTSDAIRAIDYAIAKEADIINASWGGSLFSESLSAAIQATEEAGILFVASAGNDGKNVDRVSVFPAGFENPNIVAVASLNENGYLSSFSNFGVESVDVAAPGNGIFTTAVSGGYEQVSGTSPAAAMVSGMAALIMAQFPELAVDEVKNRVLYFSTYVESLEKQILSASAINLKYALASIDQREVYIESPQPVLTVFSGGSVILEFEVSGPGPFTYQWYFNGSPIPGATLRTYTVGSAGNAQQGIYQVEVSNVSRTVLSPPMELTVADSAPLLLSQSGDYSGDEGTAFTLRADVTGSHPIRFEWYRDGVRIPGADQEFLTIRRPRLEDAGVYTVIARNTFGLVESRPIAVALTGIPFGTWQQAGSSFPVRKPGGLVWDGTYFVTGGKGGKLAYSPDGETWSHAETQFPFTISQILHDGPLKVAVQEMGPLIFSSGIDQWEIIPWTDGGTDYVLPRGRLRGLAGAAMGGGSLFLVFDESLLRAEYEDGDISSLTGVSIRSGLQIQNLAEADGTFLVQARDTESREDLLFRSTDGQNWELLEIPLGRLRSNGSHFFSEDGQWSRDGLTWRENPALSSTVDASVSLDSVLLTPWGGGVSRIDLGSGEPPDTLFWSHDHDFSLIAANDRIVLAMGSYGTFAKSDRNSLDTWEVLKSDLSGYVVDMAYGAGRFVALVQPENHSEPIISTSDDGLTWTRRNAEVEGEKLLYANGWFLVPREGRNQVYRSRDGIHWEQQEVVGPPLHYVYAVGDLFYDQWFNTESQDFFSNLITSKDGVHWDIGPELKHGLDFLTHAKGKYTAFAGTRSSGRFQIYQSSNGLNWKFRGENGLEPLEPGTLSYQFLSSFYLKPDTVLFAERERVYYRISFENPLHAWDVQETQIGDWDPTDHSAHSFGTGQVVVTPGGALLGTYEGLYSSRDGVDFPFRVLSTEDSILGLLQSRDRVVTFTGGNSVYVYALNPYPFPDPPSLSLETEGPLVMGSEVHLQVDVGSTEPGKIQSIDVFINGKHIGSPEPSNPVISYVPKDLGRFYAYAVTRLRSGTQATSEELALDVEMPGLEFIPNPSVGPLADYPELAACEEYEGETLGVFYSPERAQARLATLNSQGEWIPHDLDFTFSFPEYSPRLGISEAGLFLFSNGTYSEFFRAYHGADLNTWEPLEFYQFIREVFSFKGDLYYSGQNPFDSSIKEIFRSTDGGKSWTHLSDTRGILIYADETQLVTNYLEASTDGIEWNEALKDTLNFDPDITAAGFLVSDGDTLLPLTGGSYDGTLDTDLTLVEGFPGYMLFGYKQTELQVSTDGGDHSSPVPGVVHTDGNFARQIGNYICYMDKTGGIWRWNLLDLALKRVLPAPIPSTRSTLSVDLLIKNQGVLPLHQAVVPVKWVLQVKPALEGEPGIELSPRAITLNLSPGEARWVSLHVPIPEEIGFGEYTLLTILGDASGETDFDASNNQAVSDPFVVSGSLEQLRVDVDGNGQVIETQTGPSTYELKAIPMEDSAFVRWTGGIQSQDKEVTLSLDQSMTVTAVFRDLAFFQNLPVMRDLGQGWYELPWFGLVSFRHDRWVHSHELGWLYLYPLSETEYWLWIAGAGWFFIHTDHPGWMFWQDTGSWVYWIHRWERNGQSWIRLYLPESENYLDVEL